MSKFSSVEISISDMAIVKQVEQGQSVLYLLSAPLLGHSPRLGLRRHTDSYDLMDKLTIPVVSRRSIDEAKRA
jgi:hypothetical protein